MGRQEKKNELFGWLTSVGVHGAVFLILFFVMAWRAPDPPLPEYGIELNFGLDDQGTGDVQPQETAGDQGESATESPAAESQATESEKTQPEPDPAKDKTSEPVASKLESPVSVKEEKKAAETAKTPSKAVTEPKETVVAKTESTEKKATEDAKKGVEASHGDDTKKEGDKGSKEGTLDPDGLFSGTPGGGGTGVNLFMTGWKWADEPKIPTVPDNENGKIVFDIECDDNGDITGITTVERTLSVRAEQLLMEMIRSNSLIRTSGGKVPERSKGRITFVLRTK